MTIYKETSLWNFEAWSGAQDTLETLTMRQIDELEAELESCYPNGIDETELNDILRFETDWIAEILGFEDWDALEKENEEDE